MWYSWTDVEQIPTVNSLSQAVSSLCQERFRLPDRPPALCGRVWRHLHGHHGTDQEAPRVGRSVQARLPERSRWSRWTGWMAPRSRAGWMARRFFSEKTDPKGLVAD